MESDIENDPRAHSTPKREEAASERNIDDDSLGSPELVVGRSSGLERTGASTRSLLSVLSHSSVENISDGSYSSSSSSSTSSSSKLSSRKRRCGSHFIKQICIIPRTINWSASSHASMTEEVTICVVRPSYWVYVIP